ncbi:nucleotidyl transferase AbiEii/AbiGii toxin family protein [Glutamicibacter sp. MNS18]|uniref:nucleotidyl transferase AbiEii/AbiGii toxin family protein n=1 Tax=Glutamicibacter sp. MNS18 TaxID=2989817 RepID=UPI002236787C|nr:nucleotidyl transferase AbiEii/AbiGii toxin family protein [Glutamicibacter sp. MNS18]MCW4464258.1 nucleotidyl transferase AbiEii/AbiGii toxin family protein [Glutamicibacter sp. MNS18]
MSYAGAPISVRSLEQRIRNLEGDDGLAQRRRVSMALVVVGQMLPAGAIKGGSAMALRFGRSTRFTRDLDAARIGPLAVFRADFEEALARGWVGFTGRLVQKAAPTPEAVPAAYVMQPFEVKLDYRGRAWCTVKFELGHNEIGDAEDPELHLADDLATMFTDVVLEAPVPVRVMRADHQIALKLHALSVEGSERARDLVDLQLLENRGDLDLGQIGETYVRLFEYRRQQQWPPVVTVAEQWHPLYAEAADGVDALHSVDEAVIWVNDFIRRIASAGSATTAEDDRR